MESGSSNDVNGSSDIHLQKKRRTEDKISPAMLDFDVLDCPLCMEPLTIPIFQCDNGHLACSSCCPKLSNKCPTCASPVGHIRCRAMENVLESVFIPCENTEIFGCTNYLSYGKESIHEKACSLDCKNARAYWDLLKDIQRSLFDAQQVQEKMLD